MGTFCDKHKDIENAVQSHVQTQRIPEVLINTGTPEEVVWAAGALSQHTRLKDMPEYIDAFFEACSVIRARTGKEDVIDKYFNLGKNGKQLPINHNPGGETKWMD